MADSTTPGYRQIERELDSRLASLEASAGPDPELRGLALAAAAAARGRRDTLRAALRLLRRRSLHPGRLREVLLQTYLFAGYPRAINALAELAALEPEPAAPPRLDLDGDRGALPSWRERGEALCRKVYGAAYEKLLATMARISPELGRWMVVEGYGKVLSRPALDAKTRELAAVAALMTLDVPDQLRAHLRGSFLCGASRSEVEGVLAAAALIAPELLEPARALLAPIADRYAG
jgi:4-carboxymuconolactone decarboxylase